MKRQNTIASTLVILFVVTLYFYFGSDPEETNKVVGLQEQTEEPKSQTINPREKPGMSNSSLALITKKELRSLRNSFPTEDDIRLEVTKDSHRPPQSLMRFANTIGPLMDKAYTNNDDARLLLKELKGCALDETIALSARALCVTNADKLADIHPEIKESASNIRANVSPEVTKLLEKKNSLLKK